jgi:hypothetical protein
LNSPYNTDGLGRGFGKLRGHSQSSVTLSSIRGWAQLSDTTKSLDLMPRFLLITEEPQLPVFEDGLNRSPRA